VKKPYYEYGALWDQYLMGVEKPARLLSDGLYYGVVSVSRLTPRQRRLLARDGDVWTRSGLVFEVPPQARSRKGKR